MNFRSPVNLMVNGGTMLSLFLLTYIIWYWIAFLPRLPYSIEQWCEGDYNHERETEAPTRPTGSVLVPVIGWLTVRKISSIFTDNMLQVYFGSSDVDLIGYSVIYLIVFIYVLTSVPRIHMIISRSTENRLPRFLREGYLSWRTIDPSLRRDQWSILLSGIAVLMMNSVISFMSFILSLSIVILFVTDWFRRQDHEVIFSVGILTMAAIVFITSTASLTQEGAESWFLLTVFLIIYVVSLSMRKYDLPSRLSADGLEIGPQRYSQKG